MRGILDKIELKRETVLYIDGKKILDERGVRLISILDDVNSLLEASRRLGIPYSRVWEYIAKVERYLKTSLIEVRRGGRGGGLRLTDNGRKLVDYVKGMMLPSDVSMERHFDIDIHIAGSDDIILNLFIEEFKRKSSLNIMYSRIGSLRGLSSLLLGDAQVSAIHLIDIESGKYNIPFIDRLGLRDYVILIRGYEREVGFIYRKEIEVDSIDSIVEKKYRVVNRCLGSGIKILFDNLVRDYAERIGVDPLEVSMGIVGYDDEVDTHIEAIKKVLEGSADVTIGLKYEASSAGLGYTPITWEKFDIVVRKDFLEDNSWKLFYKDFISMTPSLIKDIDGYRLTDDFGSYIF
jgi:molybdate transport repressor ModE-like protein